MKSYPAWNGLWYVVLLLLALAGHVAAQPLVDADWLTQHLNHDNLVVLDIRNPIDGGSRAAYRAGHIPGAVYSNYLEDGWRAQQDGVPGMLPPLDHLEALIGRLGIGNQSHVVIVPGGVSASDYASATRVYWTFKVLGHDAVSILNGGYTGWTRDASRPVETGINTPPKTLFKASFQPQLRATREDVAKAMSTGVALIDNRPPPHFTGVSKPGFVQRHGTVPGAVNLPQRQFFQADTGQFTDAETLAKLWAAQGVDSDGGQITYCNTGHWATLGWFAASELLGHKNTAMYDGSMVDWAAQTALPMVTK